MNKQTFGQRQGNPPERLLQPTAGSEIQSCVLNSLTDTCCDGPLSPLSPHILGNDIRHMTPAAIPGMLEIYHSITLIH